MESKKTTLLIFTACILVVTILHGWNMFHYPYYEGDEGIYVSQAWSLVTQGQLSPYAYWYDHPPFGWMIMAAWGAIFGGNFSVIGESSIDHMRFLMLLVHMTSAGLVFFIARRLSRSTAVAVFATLFFALSPLFIYYQRRVLLDNLLTLWILSSFALLLVERLRMRHIVLSGVCFGLALLTKIPAMVFLPGILYLLHKVPFVLPYVRRAGIWLLVVFVIGMIFVGYTMVKGEFFPGEGHTSFISGIEFQLSRDSEHFFWHPESPFRTALSDWLFKDTFTVIVGTVGSLIGLWGARSVHSLRIIMIPVVLYILFLWRGGVVTNFHILPLVPFVAIAVALALWWVLKRFISDDRKILYVYGGVGVVILLVYGIFGGKDYLTADETSNHNASIRWIKENVDEDQSIMTDVQGLVDLWSPGAINEKSFERADWFSKVINDGLIRDYKYEGNWENIDYVLGSHELLRQLKNADEESIAKKAYRAGVTVNGWNKHAGHVNEHTFDSSVGNWSTLLRVEDEEASRLDRAWYAYKDEYIHAYGQVIEPEDDLTTAEMQSYAMLRAVWMHDQSTFDGVWQWTKDHLQHRDQDALISVSWKGGDKTASDNVALADANFAAALLLASAQWDDASYTEEAKVLMSDLWRQNVVSINERHYMLPTEAPFAIREDGYLYNPSYVTPVWYRLFAEIDTEHPWESLANDSYQTLHDIASMEGNTTGLPSDWLWIAKSDGALGQKDGDNSKEVDPFGYSAFRTLWYSALDAQWHDASDARAYLQEINETIIPLWSKSAMLPAIIHPSGRIDGEGNATAVDAGYLAALMTQEDQSVAEEFYAKSFAGMFSDEDADWGVGQNAFGNNWAWMAEALYRKRVTNTLQ